MMNDIGYKWQPGQQATMGQNQPPRLPNGSQGPAKLLSLRLPQRQAPNAVAPTALLQGQGMSGAPGGGLPGFLQLLQRLLGQQGMGGVPNQLPAGNLQQDFSSDTADAGQMMRLNAPGFQSPAQPPTQRVSPSMPNIPNSIPSPRFTVGQDAPYEGDAPGFF